VALSGSERYQKADQLLAEIEASPSSHLSEIMRGSRVRPQASFVTYGKVTRLFAWSATDLSEVRGRFLRQRGRATSSGTW
jgi:hypothetical protein